MLKRVCLFLLALFCIFVSLPICGYCETTAKNIGFPNSLSGMTNFVKLSNGFSEQGVLTYFSESDLLPYIAYLNQKGEISGKMFDAVIFSPSDETYPSGGSLIPGDDTESAVMSDWLLYFDSLFCANGILASLENSVGNVYSAMRIDEKFKVFLTIPYPKATQKAFGDINGNGNNNFCYTVEERISVVTWFVNKYISAFNARNFKNIELCGFYWGNREINYSHSSDELVLVSAFNKYVGDRGYKTIFGSAYCAIGCEKWSDAGFDASAMELDAMLGADGSDFVALDIENLSETVDIIKNKGMGVVLKPDGKKSFDGDNYMTAGYNYESYLYYGKQLGYMSSLKIFDQSFDRGSLSEFCYIDSSTPKGIYLRRLYDLTYSFLRMTYSNKAPEISADGNFELVYGDEQITINLAINDIDSYWDNIRIEFPKTPEHGRVAAASNKNAIIYNVDKGFFGADSFSVRVTDGFNVSQEIEITLSVSAPEDSFVSDDLSSESNAVLEIPFNQKEGIPLWAIITLVGLAFLMFGVAIAAIVTSGKKNK